MTNDATDALSRVAAFERMKNLPRGQEKLDLALQYQLVTEDTNLIVVHARHEGNCAADFPHLQKIAHMSAAGWGGSGTIALFLLSRSNVAGRLVTIPTAVTPRQRYSCHPPLK